MASHSVKEENTELLKPYHFILPTMFHNVDRHIEVDNCLLLLYCFSQLASLHLSNTLKPGVCELYYAV